MNALGVTVLLVTAAAPNYLPFKMLHSDADPFAFYVDARAQSPAGLPLAEVLSASEAAWRRWDEVPCAATAMVSLGPTSTAPDAYDGVNVSTLWVTSASDPAYDDILAGGAAAAAAVPVAYAGVLEQCDVFVNAVDFQWSTAAVTPPGALDVESLVLHEAGHCQGLDHSFEDPAEVMYPIAPLGAARRALSANDIAALCARYPVEGAVGSPCSSDGGCVASGHRCAAQRYCTRPCSAQAPCEAPFVCARSDLFTADGGSVCLAPDATVVAVGKPCSQPGDCGAAGTCVLPSAAPSGRTRWQAGYCTMSCGADGDCPADASCGEIDGQTRCLKRCREGTGDCRPGYACSTGPTGRDAVCAPECGGSMDCEAGQTCRACGEACVRVQSAAGELGAPCATPATCGEGQVCALSLDGGPGVCARSCALACLPCPDGAACLPAGPRGALLCLQRCTAGTCAPGLRCASLAGGSGCVPGCQGDLDCPVGTACAGGECVDPTSRADGGEAPAPAPRTPTGCGCGAAPAPSVLLALFALFLARPRRAKGGRAGGR